MRRWLAILLLVFLPLQFSWAAVASYCGHEPAAAAAGHLGHHDHAGHGHAAPDADPGGKTPSDGSAAGASQPDCGHCHGACAGLVVGAAAFEPRVVAGAPPDRAALPAAGPAPMPPERPQWAALA